MPASVTFLFIGGPHQVFHLAPVAAELSRRPGVNVECLYEGSDTGEALAQVRDELAAPRLLLTPVKVPRLAAWIAGRLQRHSAIKLPLLLRLAWRLRGVDAVVTPERTSAALRHLPLRRPLLIHFRHGAGDRAPPSEARLAAFDLVVVPGHKDVVRAIERHQLTPSRLRETGYIKLDYLSGRAPPPRAFPDACPVVVYNPHFDTALSSWRDAAAVIAAFAAQHRYHLIVAPHIRLALDMDAAERARWQSLAVPGHIAIDLDSPRLLDMTHVRAAGIYLGDVSSQLYEFLAEPRPVAFLDSHGAAWVDDARYAGWHLGEVAGNVDDVIAAIDRARDLHGEMADRQSAAVAEAFGDYRGAGVRGAHIVAAALQAAGRPC